MLAARVGSCSRRLKEMLECEIVVFKEVQRDAIVFPPSEWPREQRMCDGGHGERCPSQHCHTLGDF